jgi:toxin ParE1/3/4
VRLRYTRRARRHLDAIAEYIADRNPDAGGRIGERIRETVSLLSDLPYIGREGIFPGTRELIVPGLPYIVVYRIEPTGPDEVTNLGVYHGAQLRPGQARR